MAKKLFRLTQPEGKDVVTAELCGEVLEVYHAGEFQEACDQLLASGCKCLVLDLSRVHNLRSQFIGMVIKLADDASKDGRRVAVLAANRVIRVLEMFADDVGLDLKTVEASKTK